VTGWVNLISAFTFALDLADDPLPDKAVQGLFRAVLSGEVPAHDNGQKSIPALQGGCRVVDRGNGLRLSHLSANAQIDTEKFHNLANIGMPCGCSSSRAWAVPWPGCSLAASVFDLFGGVGGV